MFILDFWNLFNFAKPLKVLAPQNGELYFMIVFQRRCFLSSGSDKKLNSSTTGMWPPSNRRR